MVLQGDEAFTLGLFLEPVQHAFCALLETLVQLVHDGLMLDEGDGVSFISRLNGWQTDEVKTWGISKHIRTV